MKKIFAIVLSALLCLSLFMVAGCGSAFDADYKETDAETMNEIVDKVEDAEEGTSIDYFKGVKLVIDVKMNMSVQGKTESMAVKSNMVMTAVDDNLIMSGEIKADTDDGKVDGKVYYSDGWLYANGTYKDNQIKMKQAMPIEYFIGHYTDGAEQMMDIAFAMRQFGSLEGAKFFQAEKDGNTYIKFTFESAEMGKVEMYFIFNADFNLIGFKMQSSGKMELDGGSMESKMLISMEPYSGSINLPSDLDTYEEGEFNN